MREAPKAAVNVVLTKGESPRAELTEDSSAQEWISEISAEIDQMLASSSFRCCAPETHRHCFWTSAKSIADTLKAKQPLVFWDLNRRLGEENQCFVDDAFLDVCSALFHGHL